jgi:hypothetical protein
MSIGISLSKLTNLSKKIIDLPGILSKLQQNGLVKIVYDPARDQEPFVHITEKGKQQAIELLSVIQQTP